MKQKFGFGIIGVGMVSRTHIKALSEIDCVSLTAVMDVDSKRAGDFAAQYGCMPYSDLEQFLSQQDIDAVSICTPSGTHGELAIRAAHAGKHVIIEKPIDISLNKADAVIRACRESGVKCCVVSQHRFDDDIVKLKKAIDDGKLGRIYFGACHTKWYRNDEYYANSGWRGTYRYDGGGALINQSIHYIDLLLYLVGEAGEVYGNCATLHHSIEVEDIGVATVKFRNGALGIVEGTTIAYPGLYAGIEIYGEKGSVIIKDEKIEYWNVMSEPSGSAAGIADKTGTGVSKPDSISYLSHKRQFEDFFNAIRENREPLVNGDEGRKTLAFILAIYESSRRNAPVHV